MKKLKKDISLDEPIGQDAEGNELNLLAILEAENVNIIEYIQRNTEISKMKDFLNLLDPRELEVIIYRYGLDNNDELTQREIAERMDISRSYVSRIEKRALMKVMRAYYQEDQK